MQYYDTPRSVKEALELCESSSGTGDNSNIFYLKHSSLRFVALFFNIVGPGPFATFGDKGEVWFECPYFILGPMLLFPSLLLSNSVTGSTGKPLPCPQK